MSRRILLLSTGIVILVSGCNENASEPEISDASQIEIVTLSPAAQTVITSNDTLKAELSYVIADNIQSDYGFAVSVKFQSVIEGQTLSVGQEAFLSVSNKKDQVRLVYPLSLVWRSSNLAHPVSCFFYLQRYSSETQSTVIAKTGKISYAE